MHFSTLAFLAILLWQGHRIPAASAAVTSGYGTRSATYPSRFTANLTWEDDFNVGVVKKTILVNGQSPGPALEISVGDSVEFVVHNFLPFSTTVHFHGITQLGTPFSDGVSGISQRPIPAGETFVYKWTADEYGTFFYHAHHYGQIADGLVGPILIRPSKDQNNPFSLISNSSADVSKMQVAADNPNPLFVSDWNRWSFDELYRKEEDAGVDDYCPDATIVNGKGSIVCPGLEFINSFASPSIVPLLNGSQYTAKGCLPLSVDIATGNYSTNLTALDPNMFDVCTPIKGATEVFTVDPEAEWASINMISTASINTYAISIDEHPMWIYAADGRYISPQKVDQVVIPNGNRYSAMIQLNKPIGDYQIRITTSGINQIATANATLSYRGSKHNNNSTASVNYAGLNTTSDFVAFSDAAIVPLDVVTPAAVADVTHVLDLSNFGALYTWTLGGNESYSMTLENDVPLLFAPNSTEGLDSNLTIRTKNNQWVDLVVTSSGFLSPPHPIHKHSNKVFVIGSGTGPFNYSSVSEAMKYIPDSFNLVNPQQRDGFLVPSTAAGPSWVAVRYQVINPGAFIVHCHIQTHMSGGMIMAILDGVDAWPEVPSEYCDGRMGQ